MEENASRGPETATVPPPRGIYPARVDEKGRLKLPAKFQEWLGQQELFVTTLDKRIVRIYPIPAWVENERVLSEHAEDPKAAADVLFAANQFGADAQADAQGRLLVPSELRRLLDLENKPVWLLYTRNGVDVYNQAEYDRRSGRSSENLEDKVNFLQQKGLK